MPVTTVHSQPEATVPASLEEWPEEVVARYRTVGGATIDITQHRSETYDNQPADRDAWYFPRLFVDVAYSAVCRGCQLANEWSPRQVDEHDADLHFAQQARQYYSPQAWAQPHAAVCRALPRP
ncbi:hypothetical protein [Streptomyces sp. NPDC048442]|uniref:hypothetical protein n=1 Tax=Streptomyces sp. NPDC048442 TaxID=3154823 RepID=UPI00343AEAB5